MREKHLHAVSILICYVPILFVTTKKGLPENLLLQLTCPCMWVVTMDDGDVTCVVQDESQKKHQDILYCIRDDVKKCMQEIMSEWLYTEQSIVKYTTHNAHPMLVYKSNH